ncbi:MAG: ExbD/TolR family protein [Planctomycetota bacterium]|jgi:biopolymer transport protein ExbD
MIDLQKHRKTGKSATELNLAPLIDMIFILLIFFLVTTSFTRETGVEVNRPSAATAKDLRKDSLLIAVTLDGSVYIHNRVVDLMELRAIVEKAMKENPEKPVVILADRSSLTGRMIAVMDTCTLAGAKQVAVAAAEENR